MKKNCSLGKFNWIAARVSAVVILSLVVWLTSFWLVNDNMDYFKLQSFLDNNSFKVLFFLAILSIVIHGWIGIWTVLTDYVKNRKVRFVLEFLFVLLFGYCLFLSLYLLGG